MNLNKKQNLIKSITCFYLIVSLLLFIYTFYRAEFIYNGKQFSYYYKYYLIFIFSIIFWFIVLFLKKTRKIQTIIGATTLIFLLYSYESFLAISAHSITLKNKW